MIYLSALVAAMVLAVPVMWVVFIIVDACDMIRGKWVR